MAEASVGHQVSLGVEDELIKAYVRGVVREEQVEVLECLCHPEALHLVPVGWKQRRIGSKVSFLFLFIIFASS